MNPDEDTRITKLANRVEEHRKAKREVLGQLNQFADLLFAQLNEIVIKLAKKTEAVGKAERKTLSNGAQQIKFLLDEYELTFLTSNRIAELGELDDSEDTQWIRGRVGKECGIVWMFANMDKSASQPMYQIYVFGDGYWFGTGPAGPTCYEECMPLDQQSATDTAIEILKSYFASLRSTWRPRSDIRSDKFDVSRGAIGFEAT